LQDLVSFSAAMTGAASMMIAPATSSDFPTVLKICILCSPLDFAGREGRLIRPHTGLSSCHIYNASGRKRLREKMIRPCAGSMSCPGGFQHCLLPFRKVANNATSFLT
jgi:hypothetical protein